VPENLKGPFTAVLSYKTAPFEIVTKPAKFTVR
jgi:hypothetical protein